MTTTSCFVTIVRPRSRTQGAPPSVFNAPLPSPGAGHYWAPAIERFAKEKDISISYPLDNLTPEIVIFGSDLRAFLVQVYGDNHPFVGEVAPHLDPAYQYRVYAEDF